MKRNRSYKPAILLVSVLGALLFMSSCKKFFERPNTIAFNEDSVFTSINNAQRMVNDMYSERPFYLTLNINNSRLNGSLLDCATDLGSSLLIQSAYGAHMFNNGQIPTNYTETGALNGKSEDYYELHYRTIRKAFILIDRIDEVPDASEELKQRIKGEAKAMIAFEYFQLFKRYGGVPLIKKRLDANTDNLAIGRAPLLDVYNYVIRMCDEAIAEPGFAAKYIGQDFGRLTKAFAYGLKARAAIYIASPLFNTATPYLDFGTNDSLICTGNYDAERWSTAAQYAKEAINYCEANGYAIVNTPNKNINYTISYQYRPGEGNTEVMWASFDDQITNNGDHRWWRPRGDIGGFSANMPTLNFVKKFQKTDGTYPDWSTAITTAPNKPTEPYDNLDPRFDQIVAYNGEVYYPSTGLIWQNYDYYQDPPSGKTFHPLDGLSGPRRAKTQFAHIVRKHVYGYEDAILTKKVWQPMAPLMRLTELYMIYAEATNESLSSPSNDVLATLNIIRNRSGMPNMPTGLSKDIMRKRIQDEWAIEFAFEEYRFFDLKRWKLGDTFKDDVLDLHVIKNADNSYTYTPYKFADRVFYDWYYLYPLPPSEVNLQYGLIQNPGWN